MANPIGKRRESWRGDENLEAASREGQYQREPFDSEGQAPEAPNSSAHPVESPATSGPRLVPKPEETPKIGADYTRSPFRESEASGERDTQMGGR